MKYLFLIHNFGHKDTTAKIRKRRGGGEVPHK